MALNTGHPKRPLAYFACLSAVLAVLLIKPLAAAPMSAKDVQIIATALGFLDPAPAGGTIAVVYSDAASKADADSISASFGTGLASAGGSITAKVVDAATLGNGRGYIAIILADGVTSQAANAVAKMDRIPCITASLALVRSGGCLMSVQSEPKVSITVNHAAAQAAGIGFASVFAMLIHEISIRQRQHDHGGMQAARWAACVQMSGAAKPSYGVGTRGTPRHIRIGIR